MIGRKRESDSGIDLVIVVKKMFTLAESSLLLHLLRYATQNKQHLYSKTVSNQSTGSSFDTASG